MIQVKNDRKGGELVKSSIRRLLLPVVAGLVLAVAANGTALAKHHHPTNSTTAVPELDPGTLLGGLAVAGGLAALVIERARRRKK